MRCIRDRGVGGWMTRSVMRAAMGAVVVLAMVVAPTAARGPSIDDERPLLQRLGPSRVQFHAATGQVRFVGGTSESPAASGASLGAPRTQRQAATRFLDHYAALFGLRAGGTEMRVARVAHDAGGRAFFRFQQLHRGIPILGAQLTVQVGPTRDVISALGEASPGLGLVVQPRVIASDAQRFARESIARARDVRASGLVASRPELWVYDPALLGGRAMPQPRLVWRMDVRTPMGDVDEFVLIDALRGAVVLHFDQVAHARNRQICDANSTATKVPCTTPFARVEGGPESAVADVNDAYVFSGQTYDFYSNRFGRDSLDDVGMTLKSTVRYCPTGGQCPYQNAFWNGSQMVYGAGYARADDVVGHELTHGVTDFSSGLFYYFQSGAINEALSDIFGEFIDLTNGDGTDTAATRWQLGEDLPPGVGVVRDLQDPPLFDQPDRMQSPLYFADPAEADAGGVHYNSGVANKAAYLMVDGASFNGQTVTGIGIDKAAAVWYRVETRYLGSASDYADLGSALGQACSDLIGQTVKDSSGAVTGAIAAGDCTEVGDAVAATQMALQPTVPGTAAPEAPLCISGSPSNVFFDDLETPTSANWTSSAAIGDNNWYYPQNNHPYPGFDATYATSGDTNFFGDDNNTISDSSMRMTNAVALPAGAFLHFRHAFGFDDEPNQRYDGGVLEYSTAATGGPWIDAPTTLTTVNGYNGTIATGFGNPLAGERAFTSESHGYISTRVDLAGLAGQSVRFRYRLGTDSSVADFGWFIDDIRIYTCSGGTTRQPDGRIRLGTSGAFVGDNIYNTTGTSQKKTGSAPRGSTITFGISIQNDGSAADGFRVQAAGSSTSYNVKYLDGLTNVTTAVVAGTYQTPSLAPGASHLLTVKAKVKSSATVGSKVVRLVTISSVAAGIAQDAVKFTAKRS